MIEKDDEIFEVPQQLQEAIRIINRYSDEVVIKSFHLDLRMQYLMTKEIKRYVFKKLGEYQETFCDNNILIILAVCRRVFGAGKKKLESFMEQYERMVEDMERYYKADVVDDITPVCYSIVAETGFDMQKFKKERKISYKMDDET